MTNTLGQTTTPSNSGPSMNPFARALQEARGGGNTLNEPGFGDNFDSLDTINQQREQADKMRKERLRDQLFRQVNPVEQHDVFKASESRVKKEIEQIRYELQMLIQEVKSFAKEADLSLSSNIASPGTDGIYYISFLQQMRAFIMLLRQKVSSANTWATTFNARKRKMGHAPGMQIAGQAHEQTKTVFDTMHHERSTAYAGN